MTVSLIPSGQPQGDRQTNEAAADEAGLASKMTQAPPQIELQPPRQATPRGQGEFDAIASRTPTSAGTLRQDQDARILDEVELSSNPILRDLASRLRT